MDEARRREHFFWWVDLAREGVRHAADPALDPAQLGRDARQALTWTPPTPLKGPGEMLIAYVWICRAYGFCETAEARGKLAPWLHAAAKSAGDFLDGLRETPAPAEPWYLQD